MFLDDFRCAVDVSHRLADICCYRQEYLPTGSPLSGMVAFFAKRHMFDEIAAAAKNADCKLTVYVDDITISGMAATKALLSQIRYIIRKHSLRTQDRKSKSYPCGTPKPVTGVIVNGDNILLPNSRHLKIHHARNAVKTASPEDLQQAKRVLSGRLQEASQVLKEPAHETEIRTRYA